MLARVEQAERLCFYTRGIGKGLILPLVKMHVHDSISDSDRHFVFLFIFVVGVRAHAIRHMTAEKVTSPLDPLLASLAHFNSSRDLSTRIRE